MSQPGPLLTDIQLSAINSRSQSVQQVSGVDQVGSSPTKPPILDACTDLDSGVITNLQSSARSTMSYDRGLSVRPVLSRANVGIFDNIRTIEDNVRISLSFPYAINPRLAITGATGLGTVTQGNTNMAVVSTGASGASSAFIRSRSILPYVPGEAFGFRGTAMYTPGVPGSIQYQGGITRDGLNGVGFGYNGNQFGVFLLNNGVFNWTAQSQWNGEDKLDGTGYTGVTLDPTKLNVYEVRLAWLGGSNIEFYVKSPNGESIIVHNIQFPNQFSHTSTASPNFCTYAGVQNTTNTSNVSLMSPSMALFQFGSQSVSLQSILSTIDAGLVTAIPTTGKTLVTLQNKPNNVLGGVNTNMTPVLLENISLLCTGSNTKFVISLNPVLGGTPSFNDVNTLTSVCSYDLAGTYNAATPGYFERAYIVSSGGGTQPIVVNLIKDKLYLYPGELVSIIAFSETSTSSAHAVLSFNELQSG